MVGAMKTIQMSLAVILGSIIGNLFYFLSPEWCILLEDLQQELCLFYRRAKCQLI